MSIERLKGVLAILLLSSISLALLVSIVVAKPLGVNPAQVIWPSGTIWGTNLRFENNDAVPTISEIWWGVGASDSTIAAPPDPPAGIIVEFLAPDYDISGNTYGTEVKAAAAEPASYTWQVQFRKVRTADPKGGTVSSVMENIDTRFVPQDYSVVLENTDLGIHINLRASSDNVTGTNIRTVPILSSLYVDNAVNIQSIENLDPLIGKPGDNLRLRVIVKNTGRYTDNYTVSAGGSLDPTIINLAPDSTDNVIVTAQYPSGTDNIVITAAGTYATDQYFVTSSGLMVRKVEVGIMPNVNLGENGDNLTFDVLVKNVGDLPENYTLTIENVWAASLSSNRLDNINGGENKHTTLFVKIPNNANPGDSDNVTVIATSMENAEVSENATCTARVGSFSVEVSIVPGSQENVPGGMLNYTIKVSNTGTLNDVYTLNPADNIDGNNYWEDNISLDVNSLAVPAGENRTTTLRVHIPDNAAPGTDDKITVTATSQANNTVKNSASCTAHVAIVRIVQVSIKPPFQENDNGGTLKYDVTVKNLGNVTENFLLTRGDNSGWALNLDDNWLFVPNNGTETAKLTVIIPDDAIIGTLDNMWVKATAKDNAALFDNQSCLAQVKILKGVKVVIDPSPPLYLENENGGTVKFNVTVVNLGNVLENFLLTKGDNAGWALSLDDNWLLVPIGENRQTKLIVTLPNNGAPVNLMAGWNLVCFTAASTIDTPSSLFTGLTYLTDYLIYSWKAPNGPYVLQGINQAFSDNLGYWIWIDQNKTVRTTGVLQSTRDVLMVSGWNLVGFSTNNNSTPNNLFTGLTYLTDYIMYSWNAPNGPYLLQGINQVLRDNAGYWVWLNQNKTVTGSASISNWDNIWVKATSKNNSAIFDNESGRAHVKPFVLTRGVQSVITPLSQDNENDGTLTYTITVNNTGNIQENFQLTKGDKAGWSISLNNTSLLVPAGENRQTKLTVNIPVNANGGTFDNVWVKVTSKDNAAVFDNESCLAQVRIVGNVQVVINPSPPNYLENENGDTVKFSITVVNLSNAQGNFALEKGENAGWTLALDSELLLVPKGGSVTTKLTVSIPTSAIGGTWDAIWVKATSQDNAAIFDNESCLAHVKIVVVEITPSTQTGNNGDTLEYNVTVKNLSGDPENFLLTKGDGVGWALSLDDSWLYVPNSDSRTTKLNVTIPGAAAGGQSDAISVQATSKDNATVHDNKSCLAQVATKIGANVQITPNTMENLRNDNVTFSITVNNTGNISDRFGLSWSDTENWGNNISLLASSLQIGSGGQGTTILKVHIPDNAVPGTDDHITVTALSRADGTTSSSDNCTVHVTLTNVVSVSISPAENSALPGKILTFRISVTNKGDNTDNYILQASDNLGWNLSLVENSLENVSSGSTRTTALTVAIPVNTASNSQDNIVVTATSRDNENITSSATCIARSTAVIGGVSLSIAPAEAGGMPGSILTFTIRVVNTGNMIDNYDLNFGDNAGWNPSISENIIEVPSGDNHSVTLRVTVPDDAIPGTVDELTVTVTSRENVAASSSVTCLARALELRRVDITITPDYHNGAAGALLNYTVRVTNSGRAADTYRLVVSGTTGWRTSIAPDSLTLNPGESGEAILTITVPAGASGSSMLFYIWAISSTDQTVRNDATCRAIALGTGEGAGLSIPWIQIIIIAAIIILAVFAVGYLTRRRERRVRRPRKVLTAVFDW